MDTYDRFIEILRSTTGKDFSEITKLLQPLLDEARSFQANDLWYTTETIWLNMKRLIDNGVPVSDAKDIVLAVFKDGGFSKPCVDALGSAVGRLSTAGVATNYVPDFEVTDVEPECGGCGSPNVIAGSGLCSSCYVGETGAN